MTHRDLTATGPAPTLTNDLWPEQVRRRKARAEEVQRRFEAFRAWYIESGATVIRINFRCAERHAGGKVPILAVTYVTEHGYLFSSRIEWKAPDFYEPPHWLYEDVILALDASLSTTETLRASGWFDGTLGRNRATTPRWLVDQAPTLIREVLDIPDRDDLARRSLWVRCPACMTTERWDADRVLAAVRESTAI